MRRGDPGRLRGLQGSAHASGMEMLEFGIPATAVGFSLAAQLLAKTEAGQLNVSQGVVVRIQD